MELPAGRSLSGCRCCFHRVGNKKSTSAEQPEQKPVHAAADSSAASPAGNVTAQTAAIQFLDGPKPRDEVKKVITPVQQQGEEEAAQTALQAVTPVVTGVAATAGLCLVWAAAASMTFTAGAPTCAAVVAGSALAAVAGLATSACTVVRLSAAENAKPET
ncbi:hypothetical protein Emed_002842 [Eimeria media]